MNTNKWQKPTHNTFGMSNILRKEILDNVSYVTYLAKHNSLAKPLEVVVHSYKEVGTTVVVCCEVIFEDGHRKLGNICI